MAAYTIAVDLREHHRIPGVRWWPWAPYARIRWQTRPGR